jgi:AcrR family transcriptional regulator
MSPGRRRAAPGKPAPVPPDIQARITDAAMELFAAQGYEATTVEAITQGAGVARRTFFRYFASKEDVIFPDHQRMLAETEARLATLERSTPVAAVCEAVRLVFESYVSAPERSVARYQLTRSVPELRHREIASVEQYQRLFTRYLTTRMDDPLTAELAAAAVVVAHNHVLRDWLRDGGGHSAYGSLDAAFARVRDMFEGRPGRTGQRVVVAVFESDLPAETVAGRVGDLLGR